MLPSRYLPSGALAEMQAIARGFMTTPIYIYDLVITYNTYGEQIITSGLIATVSGYLGKLSGRDLELLQMNTYHGVRTDTAAIVLFPNGTHIDNEYILRANDKDWRVVVSYNDLQDSVTVYEKVIIAQTNIVNERYQIG